MGPIGVLCIRRTLANGRLSGLASGLGAATADALYGTVAAFGLTFISSLLLQQQYWIRILGGAFLLYLGLRIFLSQPAGVISAPRGVELAGDYFSTFFLTLTNPLTILSFAAIFAGLGVMDTGGDYLRAGIMVLGVFMGSALWWLILSSVVAVFRNRFNLKGFRWVNRISGLVLVGFGLMAWLSLGG